MNGIGGHQKHGRGNRVWLTPKFIIDELGPFDLDPCFGSPRPWNTAANHYGPEDGLGGLSLPWFGNVWCNPPYDNISKYWLKKCADHGKSTALIFARTETETFQKYVWKSADHLLFIEGRLFFHHPDGTRAKHNGGAPSVLVAYGEHATKRLSECSISGHHVRLK